MNNNKQCVVRILSSSSVSAGYYENNNVNTNSINIFTKEKFFFNDTNRDNNWLRYDWTNLTITVPTDKTFNESNFPSVFNTNNNWGNKIITNLNKYWNNWEKSFQKHSQIWECL